MTAALKIIQDNPDIGYSIGLKTFKYGKHNKKAMLSQGNRAMPL